MKTLNKIKKKSTGTVKEVKSLYTPAEQMEVKELLAKPYTEETQKRLHELQAIQVAREVRIIEDKTTEQDAKDGITRKEFPWLAKFNY